MKFPHNDPLLKHRRKDLRNRSTTEEVLLWCYLKNDQLGVRFRRQFGIGPYITDFYCPKYRLVIELDGSQHYYEKGLEYDKVRDSYLKELDYKILRFSNDEIINSIDGVIMKIKEHLK
jgi:very-short-patch-repair endonuclease